ncbi:hypothetical protein [Pedobacter glucosidilyticus]|uniref:hypothetical protein n=1 Tax=Pedobacter glucosidilyticus TaxID=1122941 RepID=UPI0026EA67A0|nr:hypothetical protein [Pedobacter glucosidilyticus]
MYNIILICTAHLENGKCNSDELFDILKEIKPEVIFDELTSDYSDMYYSDSFDTYCVNCILRNKPAPVVPLEVKCIKKYKQYHRVKIVPVDIDVSKKLSNYQNEITYTFLKIFKHEDYIKLENERDALVAQEGFQYLNSDKFLDFLDRKESIEKNILECDIENERLLNTYRLFYAEHRVNRENSMIQNIYNYSKENQYQQAVFLIGADHKKSIMQKIIGYEELSEIKLNWRMYGSR